MKKMKLLFVTAIISVSVCLPAFAGTWTHTYDDGYHIGNYDSLWFYVKDDGSYAKEEWVQDSDGTWYWIDKYNQLPQMEGLSADGYLFNSSGAYVDVADGTKKYLTRELSSQVVDGMTYDQVINILGKEHDIYKEKRTADGALEFQHLNWYSSDAKARQDVILKNGNVTHASSNWK
ncbi:hypothetical protein [Lacrimispora sp.]|uniref:hypothetical protein n=1 Tax=Lacrimispora sp. TaxID=2719234 RepID=UPI0032E45945